MESLMLDDGTVVMVLQQFPAPPPYSPSSSSAVQVTVCCMAISCKLVTKYVLLIPSVSHPPPRENTSGELTHNRVGYPTRPWSVLGENNARC